MNTIQGFIAHGRAMLRSRDRWLISFVAFGLYGVVAILVTWPSITNLQTTVVGRVGGDAYLHIWYIWWLKTSIFVQRASPAVIEVINYPNGATIPLILTLAPSIFPASLLALVVSPVVAYNLSIILSPALSALAMFWLGIELTGNRYAAFVGGLLFGFYANLLGHLRAGHLSVIVTFGFPLFVIFLRRLLHSPSWKNAAATGVCTFLAATYPTHPAYFLTPVAVVMVAAAYTRLRDMRVWLALGGALLIGAGLLLPLYGPALAATNRITAQAIQIDSSIDKSIDVASLFTPPFGHPLVTGSLEDFGRRVVGTEDESHGYLGYIALGLALLGIWAKRRAIADWVIITFSTMVLSLGPVLKFAGQLPAVTAQGRTYRIVLPYALLAQLPFFQWGRTPARYSETVHFGIAVLAIYGMATVPRRLQKIRLRLMLTGIVSAAVVFEQLIAFPFPTAPAFATPSLAALAADDSTQAVLNIPASYTTHNLALYGQTNHERPILGSGEHVFWSVVHGEVGREFLDALLRPMPETDVIPLPSSADRAGILAAYDVGAVMNQHMAESYDPTQREFLIAEFGEPVASSEIDSLFVVPKPSVAEVSILQPDFGVVYALHPGEWQPVEQWGDAPARWFTDRARIYLYTPQAQTGGLRLTTIPGLQLHRVRVSLNGTPVATLIVGDWATYETPQVSLPAGLSVVTLEDLDGAELQWGDLRCVGGTALAGRFTRTVTCNPHQRGERRLSVAVQEFSFQPRPSALTLAQFGEALILESASLPAQVRAGEVLVVYTNWRTAAAPTADLTLFVHLWNQDGELISQLDLQPLNNQFSTLRWDANAQIGFHVPLLVPDDTPVGELRVEVGWYDSGTLERVPILSANRDSHDNVLVLGTVGVKPH